MIIKEQRGKWCLKWALKVGDVRCEECDHFKFRLSGRVNEQGIEGTDEFCELLTEVGKLG